MLLADKGYDSGPFRTWLRNKRMRPVIPGKSNRKKKIRHDKQAYKGRNVVERLFEDEGVVLPGHAQGEERRVVLLPAEPLRRYRHP